MNISTTLKQYIKVPKLCFTSNQKENRASGLKARNYFFSNLYL